MTVGSDTSSFETSTDDLGPAPVQILYATETGVSESTSHQIARHLHLSHIPCEVASISTYPLNLIPELQYIIFVVSTTGHGTPPRPLLPFWNLLMRSDMPQGLMDETSFVVLGLGDSGYERFNWTGKLLRRRLLTLGGHEFMRRDEQEGWWADEREGGGIDSTVNPFLDEMIKVLGPIYPEASHQSRLPDHHRFPPSFSFQPVSSQALPPSDENYFPQDEHDPSNPWVMAQLTKFDRMTSDDWKQDVRFLEFDFDYEGFSTKARDYLPGAILEIQPSNTKATVDQFFVLQPHLDPDLNFHLVKNTAEGGSHLLSSLSISEDTKTPTYCLFDFVKSTLDLTSVPRKSFFTSLIQFTSDEREIERLNEFLDPQEGPDDIYEYATQPRRSLIETLSDFKGVRIELDWLLDVFPRIRRREFSIASSSKTAPGKVQLSIAMVNYKTSLKVPRIGLCTSYLASLPLGAVIRTRLQPGLLQLPLSLSTPVILVGPGTGVAPMRAMIQYRTAPAEIEGEKVGTTRLYFGFRKKEKDYLFGEEWDKLNEQSEGKIVVRAHGSQDQERKVYVQNMIKDDSLNIRDLIINQGAYLYISGSSNAMPRAVRAAVASSIAQSDDPVKLEEAKRYVVRMEEEKRLQEECWMSTAHTTVYDLPDEILSAVALNLFDSLKVPESIEVQFGPFPGTFCKGSSPSVVPSDNNKDSSTNGLADLKNLRLVERRWGEAATAAFFRRYKINRLELLEFIFERPHLARHIQWLDLLFHPCYEKSQIDDLLYEPSSVFQALLKITPALRKLSLQGPLSMSITETLTMFPHPLLINNLRELSLVTQATRYDDPDFLGEMGRFQNTITDLAKIMPFIKRHQSLQGLQLIGYVGLVMGDVVTMMQELNGAGIELSNLCVEIEKPPSAEELFTLGKHQNRLQSLKLMVKSVEPAEAVDVNSLVAPLALFSHLKRVDFGFGYHPPISPTIASRDLWSYQHSVTSSVFVSNPSIETVVLRSTASALPVSALQVLSMAVWRKVVEDEVRASLDEGSSEICLELRECTIQRGFQKLGLK